MSSKPQMIPGWLPIANRRRSDHQAKESLGALMKRWAWRYRSEYDDDGLTWTCRVCGEPIRFTHRATVEAMDAALAGHCCPPRDRQTGEAA